MLTNHIRGLVWFGFMVYQPLYRSHYSNMQNKQQEQHLLVQQPQLADKQSNGQ